MPGLLYVPEGEGGYPRMEGAVFPRRRKRKRTNEYERGEDQTFVKMLPHKERENEMMHANKAGMKGQKDRMHRMPNGMMMSDDEMKKMMNEKKKKPAVMHPREAMKKLKKMSAYDY